MTAVVDINVDGVTVAIEMIVKRISCRANASRNRVVFVTNVVSKVDSLTVYIAIVDQRGEVVPVVNRADGASAVNIGITIPIQGKETIAHPLGVKSDVGIGGIGLGARAIVRAVAVWFGVPSQESIALALHIPSAFRDGDTIGDL